MDQATSDTQTRADNPAHHSWCQQFRPTCCDRGPVADRGCLPCRASFAAGQEVQATELDELRTAIKEAYFEGIEDGRGGPYNENTNDCSGEELWQFSGARAATGTKET